jgi:hypothetical protein
VAQLAGPSKAQAGISTALTLAWDLVSAHSLFSVLTTFAMAAVIVWVISARNRRLTSSRPRVSRGLPWSPRWDSVGPRLISSSHNEHEEPTHRRTTTSLLGLLAPTRSAEPTAREGSTVPSTSGVSPALTSGRPSPSPYSGLRGGGSSSSDEKEEATWTEYSPWDEPSRTESAAWAVASAIPSFRGPGPEAPGEQKISEYTCRKVWYCVSLINQAVG